MSTQNELYHWPSDTRRSEDGMQLFGYFRRVLADRWPFPARISAMLDLSRGTGVLAAEFARLGFRVTAMDLSEGSMGGALATTGGLVGTWDQPAGNERGHWVGSDRVWPIGVGAMAAPTARSFSRSTTGGRTACRRSAASCPRTPSGCW